MTMVSLKSVSGSGLGGNAMPSLWLTEVRKRADRLCSLVVWYGLKGDAAPQSAMDSNALETIDGYASTVADTGWSSDSQFMPPTRCGQLIPCTLPYSRLVSFALGLDRSALALALPRCPTLSSRRTKK
jgi:hypothetical protein